MQGNVKPLSIKRKKRTCSYPGAGRSFAEFLEVKVTSVGSVRATLIRKGMVYSPAHGEMAFTVPLFDEFMRRVLPET